MDVPEQRAWNDRKLGKNAYRTYDMSYKRGNCQAGIDSVSNPPCKSKLSNGKNIKEEKRSE
jgi:hypothetical protein